jgi:hypothetical protein
MLFLLIDSVLYAEGIDVVSRVFSSTDVQWRYTESFVVVGILLCMARTYYRLLLCQVSIVAVL